METLFQATTWLQALTQLVLCLAILLATINYLLKKSRSPELARVARFIRQEAARALRPPQSYPRIKLTCIVFSAMANYAVATYLAVLGLGLGVLGFLIHAMPPAAFTQLLAVTGAIEVLFILTLFQGETDRLHAHKALAELRNARKTRAVRKR